MSHVIYHMLHATIPRVTITRLAKHAIAMNGTRVDTNVQLTFVIHQQVTHKSLSNSVHNSENYTHNALINSRIVHVIKIF